MPIQGIEQPQVISIGAELRLRKYDGKCEFALDWYQDAEMLMLVENKVEPYDMEKLERMYNYLDGCGELYFIEALENGIFRPVGDVTFWQDDMPIVIGDSAYRHRGIGRAVVKALTARAHTLGMKRICVDEIYSFNAGSRALFESCGFREYRQTDNGAGYELKLDI